MNDYEKAVEIVGRHLDEADFEGQPADRIERAEATLGLRFPPTYRRFLTEFGAGGIGAEETYGLVNDDFEDHRPPQAVGLTLLFRRDGVISDGFVVVGNLGQGSYYAIDTRVTRGDGESPVVLFTPGLDATPEVVAPTFGTYFLQTLQLENE